MDRFDTITLSQDILFSETALKKGDAKPLSILFLANPTIFLLALSSVKLYFDYFAIWVRSALTSAWDLL